MSVAGNVGTATDTGVKLTIDIGYDDTKLRQLVAAEVARQIKDAPSGGARQPGQTLPGGAKPEPGDTGYNVRGGKGYSRGIGQYGYGNEPRSAFKEQEEPFRTLPKSAGAQALDEDQTLPRDFSPITGEDTYAQLRGFQQSKVNRQGGTVYTPGGDAKTIKRTHTISPAFQPDQAPALATFAQQREMEKRQRDAERALALIERGNARMGAAQQSSGARSLA